MLAAEKTEISGGAEPEFSDVSEDNWFYPYVKIAYQNKIIKGNENGSFEPDKYVDFMDIGTICYRAFQKPSMVSFFGDTPRRCDAVHVLSMFESSENTLIQVDGAIEKSSLNLVCTKRFQKLSGQRLKLTVKKTECIYT